MHEDRIIGARFRTRLGHVALFAALAVVPVLAFNSLATAGTSSDPTAGARPGLTDEQRQCLTDQGITLPLRSSNADKPALTDEQRQQLRAAGQACGLHGMTARPGTPPMLGGLARGLTGEQRQCLTDQGVSLPARSTDGARPSLSAEQRAALRQAAETCGLFARGHRGGLGTI